jgi:hypothetical protein
MRIQAVVVFIGLLLALAAGVFAGGWYGASPVAGWLAVGSVPVVWGLLHLIERAMGREIWHYSAVSLSLDACGCHGRRERGSGYA